MIIAHKDDKGRVQSLDDHLINVARHSKEIGDQVGLGNFAYLLGLFHDLGKADEKFQRKIANSSGE